MELRGLVLVLVMGVVLVNGWTDAPNAIAGVVGTGGLPFRRAVELAALWNLLGVGVSCLLHSRVADSITGLVDFAAGQVVWSLAALAAALCAVILYAVVAWCFGIPTSESHGLIAALAGAALALNPAAGVRWDRMAAILLGMVLSLLAGWAAGWAALRVLGRREHSRDYYFKGQRWAARWLSFLHGAQDGQKFAAIFVITELLVQGKYHTGPVDLSKHGLVVVLCSATLALGTSIGGKRIIEEVSGQLARLTPRQGFAADWAAVLCLAGASLVGMPVSTTHVKTATLVGAADREAVGLASAGKMILAWVLTLPVCGLLGWWLTRLWLQLL